MGPIDYLLRSATQNSPCPIATMRRMLGLSTSSIPNKTTISASAAG